MQYSCTVLRVNPQLVQLMRGARAFPALITHLDSRGVFPLSGELGVGVSCCAAQADRDPSETPPPARRVVHHGGCECRCVGGVGQASRRVFPQGWVRSMRSAGRDGTPHFSSREKIRGAHTPHAHNLPRARCTTTHVHGTLSVSRHVCVCACVDTRAVALCRHVNE